MGLSLRLFDRLTTQGERVALNRDNSAYLFALIHLRLFRRFIAPRSLRLCVESPVSQLLFLSA